MKDSVFDPIHEHEFVLAYFSVPDCSVCTVLRPKVEELLSDYKSVHFLYIDTHQHPMGRGQFMVFAAPTIILFQHGKELKRWSRHVALNDLLSVLDRCIPD